MTKKRTYGYRRRGKFNLIFSIIIFCISCFIAFNIADIVSSLIMNKGSIFYNGKYYISSSTYYAVSAGAFKQKDDAENFASSVKLQGGAGYIHQSGDYYVLLAMYSSTVDANSVIQKLKEKDINAVVININIPKLNIKFSDSDKNIIKATESFLDCYKFLYDLSIQYDSGSLSVEGVKNKVRSKLDDLSFVQSLNPTTKEGLSIKEKSINTVQRLKTIINMSQENCELNSGIKYVYMQIVFDYISLCKSISWFIIKKLLKYAIWDGI